MSSYLGIASTPSVLAEQVARNGRDFFERARSGRAFAGLTERETAFIAARDSFFLATVSETGWPYVQHRGGPPGFLKVLDARTLAFADFRGNRQHISTGNAAANDRASLFLLDPAAQRRLKIFAHLRVQDIAADAALVRALVDPGYDAVPERAILLDVEAFDWNCNQHIVPRFTEAEIAAAIRPLRERLAALEAENAALRLTAGRPPERPGSAAPPQ